MRGQRYPIEADFTTLTAGQGASPRQERAKFSALLSLMSGWRGILTQQVDLDGQPDGSATNIRKAVLEHWGDEGGHDVALCCFGPTSKAAFRNRERDPLFLSPLSGRWHVE